MLRALVVAAVFSLPMAALAVEQCKYACTCASDCADICRDGPVFTYCASTRCAQDMICQNWLKEPKEQDKERAAAHSTADSLLVCRPARHGTVQEGDKPASL